MELINKVGHDNIVDIDITVSKYLIIKPFCVLIIMSHECLTGCLNVHWNTKRNK